MYGYIYLTTNQVTNKMYIGQHKSEIFDHSYLGSGKLLRKAIAKYGRENFTCILLKECFSKAELNQSEIEYISKYKADTSDSYYNIAKGGDGHTCKPWNKGLRGLKVSENRLKALDYGRHLPSSEKHKKQLSERRKSCIVSEDTRKLLSQNAKGRVAVNNGTQCKKILPEELDNYLAQGWKRGQPKNYSEDSYNKFKASLSKKSAEEKLAIREKKQACMLGKIWVTNGLNSVQIFPEKLDDYLANGYYRGRVLKKKK